jgi:hypothetical protein
MVIKFKHHIIALFGYILAFFVGVLFAAIERAGGNDFEVEKLNGFMGALIGMYLFGIFMAHRQGREAQDIAESSAQPLRNRQTLLYLGSAYSIPVFMLLVIVVRELKNT